MPHDPKLIDKLYTQALPATADLLRAVAASADELGFGVWLVGGAVRDLILGVQPLDLDVVTEGDASLLAKDAADRCNGKIVRTSRFGTTEMECGGRRIDLAMARSETYRTPGALPAVTPSDLDSDLRRRDFTCNAIAMALNGPDCGSIVDPTGGLADLDNGTIRVIHDGSFRDDPTRMLRAARYEQRFGFTINAETEALIRRDLAHLDAVSGPRIRREIERTMREARPELAFRRMDRLGILSAIAPGLHFEDEQVTAMERRRAISRASEAAQWPILCWSAGHEEREGICARLSLPREQRDNVLAVTRLREVVPALETSPRPSEWSGILGQFPVATVAALVCISRSPTVRDKALDHLQRLRRLKPCLTGDDLVVLGVPGGPAIGEVLAKLKAGVLDGDLRTRDDEEAAVCSMLAELLAASAG
jgi:tRNA nucleotidyltransferase (CCA-adding enzyme)